MDPASISSGWALFKGQEFVSSGSVIANKSIGCSHRLWFIQKAYADINAALQPDEVHVENFRMRLAKSLHHSVGAIMSAFTVPVEQDIWMAAWQKYCGFKKGRPYGRLEQYADRVASEDELSAIGLGLYFLKI